MEKQKVRIQDDLFAYVNGDWIEKAVIPDDLPSCGGFADLDIGVEKTLMADFSDMATGKKPIPNKYMGDAIKLYEKGLDTTRRNEEGISPLLPALKEISSIENVGELNEKLKEFVLKDWPLPFNIGVDSNMKDTLHYAAVLSGPRTFLPDTTYYFKPELKAQKEALTKVFSSMALALLDFTPLSKEEKSLCLKDALAFDEIVASLVKSQEEWSEYTKCYNPMSEKAVADSLKPLDFDGLLQGLFGKTPSEIIVYEPRFLEGFKKLFTEESLSLYKHWAYLKLLLTSAQYLSEEMRTIGSTFHRALSGAKVDASITKQAYRSASSAYSEPLGIYYGQTYFGEEAKKDVVSLVKDIISTYERRMEKNDFLSKATKEKAILKLKKIVIKMGYPEKCAKMYERLTTHVDSSFYEAMSVIAEEKNAFIMSRLYEDVDRGEWIMPGHLVNACYNPYTNDITFPAAILQPPFYSIKQTRSENLGGIGTVIGHEISHAFDNNGAQCDENGNLNNWWTEEDFGAFTKRTKAMIDEFDGIPFAGSKVNGAFVVSENIADNGGMAVTLDIMSHLKDANYKEYFINAAKVWCRKARPQFLQLLLSIDVHSPAELRANMQPRNFPEWYKTFDVKSTDKMYLAPEKRVDIW